MNMQEDSGTVPLCACVRLGCKSQDTSTPYGACHFTRHNGSARTSGGSGILSRGDHLFHQGDTLKDLYVVHSGAVKSYFAKRQGAAHIVKFHLPGDMVGLDALADGCHTISAQALETTSVCRVSVPPAAEANQAAANLHWRLLKLASQEMVNEHKRAVLLSQHDASERLALFLLQLSQRYRHRGLSACDFNLSMSRRDIASFLALTVETVSRMFTHFHSKGLISVDHRRIHLVSLEGLRQIVSTEILSMV